VPDGPRVRVAALILYGGKVVLVRHRARDSSYHLLPGGGVDYRETLAEALVREVAEETGLVVEIGPPILINDTIDPAGSRHVVNITFTAAVVGGEITDAPQDSRVEAVELVDPADLATLDLRPPLAEAITTVLDGSALSTSYLGSLFREAAG
jgi:ADP-ribose pyrophosphatase YjhB (NUDIX family)